MAKSIAFNALEM